MQQNSGTWRKSSYSGVENGCLEVRDDVMESVPVRDSKDPEGADLIIPNAAWQAFVNLVR
ncbi:DUF397 domain-containing protein [Streptomyces aidingensis]|uniref:DUF397 domain-containing protein n=1 Tax=Streptomyces aidingensis TaxID=910347 RepID=A0A1I1TJD6_9ACTN|nr:DUF397 domain-containing protein [Streptomyces aidingensis]SFD58756.1 protein of unknown function [Streptomyces aidingensis]